MTEQPKPAGAAGQQVPAAQGPADQRDPEACGLAIFRECVPIFETLKDEQRLKLLVKLIHNGPMSVGQLVDDSELSPPAVSHHLKLLLQVELVSYRKQGTKRIYRSEINQAVNELKRLIASLERGDKPVEEV